VEDNPLKSNTGKKKMSNIPVMLQRSGMYPFASSRQEAMQQIRDLDLAKRIPAIEWLITANRNMKNVLQFGTLLNDSLGTAYFQAKAQAEKDDP
jgi:hypothetical protein